MININAHIAGLNYNQKKIITYLEYSTNTSNHNIEELNQVLEEMRLIIENNKLEITRLKELIDPVRKDWTDLYDF